MAPAAALLNEALAIATGANDSFARGWTMLHWGHLLVWQGDLASARRCYLESLDLRRKFGNRHYIAVTWGFVGDVLCLDGEFVEALAAYEEVLTLYRAVGARLAVARTQGRIGYLLALQGDAEKAAQHLAESLAILREPEHQSSLIYCFIGYAALWQLRLRWTPSVWLLAYAKAFRIVTIARASFRLRLERGIAAARAHLEPAAFDAAWEAGRALTLEQVIALALEDRDD